MAGPEVNAAEKPRLEEMVSKRSRRGYQSIPDELRGKEDTARKVGQGAEGMPGLSAASVRNHFWKPVFWSRTIS